MFASDRKKPPRLLSLVAVLALAGCSYPVDLRPAPGADDAMWLDQAAVDEVEDVEVVAQEDTWPGDAEVLSEVTPVRVVIDNSGDDPIRVRLSEFALIANDGTRYAALPPFAIDGMVSSRVDVDPPPFEPHYRPRGFLVSDTIGPTYYPAYEVWDGNFYRDAGYYVHYSDYWVDIALPTPTMLAYAMPEGVVSPGGEVAGYVYFEKVDPSDAQVRFRADVVNADGGDEIGEVSIPFVVN